MTEEVCLTMALYLCMIILEVDDYFTDDNVLRRLQQGSQMREVCQSRPKTRQLVNSFPLGL